MTDDRPTCEHDWWLPDPGSNITDELAAEVEAQDRAAHDDPDLLVELVVDALEPLGFESYIIDSTGKEPCCVLELDGNREVRITAVLAMRCDCCQLDGTHDHTRCEHPCCTEGDDESDNAGVQP